MSAMVKSSLSPTFNGIGKNWKVGSAQEKTPKQRQQSLKSNLLSRRL
jgi:hypothetical protein